MPQTPTSIHQPDSQAPWIAQWRHYALSLDTFLNAYVAALEGKGMHNAH